VLAISYLVRAPYSKRSFIGKPLRPADDRGRAGAAWLTETVRHLELTSNQAGTLLAHRGFVRHARLDCGMPLTSINTGGRGRYRTADRWCAKPSLTGHRVSRCAIASLNAQFSGWFVSTLSTECRVVFARLGALLAKRGLGRQALDRVCLADLPFRCQNRTIHLPVELRGLQPVNPALWRRAPRTPRPLFSVPRAAAGGPRRSGCIPRVQRTRDPNAVVRRAPNAVDRRAKWASALISAPKIRTEPLNLQLNLQQHRRYKSRPRSPGIGLWRG
jgi:hypothetical protein